MVFVVAIAVLTSDSSYAADVTDTFTVSATVIASCDVSAGDLAFGNYDPVTGAAVAGTSTINVTCSNGTGWTLKLDDGSAGSFAPRTMLKVADALDYNLYTEVAHTNVWNDTTVVGTGTGDGTAQAQTVYGLIAASQFTAPVGDYSDTITATVTY